MAENEVQKKMRPKKKRSSILFRWNKMPLSKVHGEQTRRTSEWLLRTISWVRLPRNKHTKRISIIERERRQNATVSMGRLANFQLCRGKKRVIFLQRHKKRKNSSQCAHNFCPRIYVSSLCALLFSFFLSQASFRPNARSSDDYTIFCRERRTFCPIIC